jgi:hypothetical protein
LSINGAFVRAKHPNGIVVLAPIALAFVVLYFTLSLKTELQSANNAVRRLEHELALKDKAIAFLGTPLPKELFQKLRATVSGSSKGVPVIFYCVSLESCTPCVEENIEFFRSLTLAAPGSFHFCVIDKVMGWKEASTLRHRYRIDWDAAFLEFDPAQLGVTELPTVVLASPEGRELFRFSPSSDNRTPNRFGERIASQVILSNMQAGRP